MRCPGCDDPTLWQRPTFREWIIPTVVCYERSIYVEATTKAEALEKAKAELGDDEVLVQNRKIETTVLSRGVPAPVIVQQPLCGSACPCLKGNLCYYKPEEPEAYDVCPWVTVGPTVDNTKETD